MVYFIKCKCVRLPTIRKTYQSFIEAGIVSVDYGSF